MTLRAARPDDAEAIEAVRVAGWKTAYRGMVSDAVLDAFEGNVEQRRRHLESGTALQLVAVAHRVVAGWIAAGACRDADTPVGTGEVYACYVAPERWRTGVGTLLMRSAVGALWAAGPVPIVVWVLEANRPARDFYEREGFLADGGRKVIDLNGPVVEVRHRRGVPSVTPSGPATAPRT